MQQARVHLIARALSRPTAFYGHLSQASSTILHDQNNSEFTTSGVLHALQHLLHPEEGSHQPKQSPFTVCASILTCHLLSVSWRRSRPFINQSQRVTSSGIDTHALCVKIKVSRWICRSLCGRNTFTFDRCSPPNIPQLQYCCTD